MSLARFVRLLRSLCSATLSYACFVHELPHFAHFLVRQLKFLYTCSRCELVSREETRLWRSQETRPKSIPTHVDYLETEFFLISLIVYRAVLILIRSELYDSDMVVVDRLSVLRRGCFQICITLFDL